MSWIATFGFSDHPFSKEIEDRHLWLVVSRSWWKKEKASSSGELIHSSCPPGSGCRRMTPWEAIAGKG